MVVDQEDERKQHEQDTHVICQVPLTHKTKDKSIMTKTMHHIRDYTTAVKHGRALKPYSYTERKVREATRNTSWGPHGGQLVEIAQMSYKREACGIIFQVLEERCQCPPEKWRNVNKALQVLDYLVQRGSSDALALASSETMMRTLKRLEGFSYVTADTEQRDVGATVRQRAKALCGLLGNEERLGDVRTKGAIQSMRMAGMQVVPDVTTRGSHDDDDDEDDDDGGGGGNTCGIDGRHSSNEPVEEQVQPRHERTLSRESTKGVSEEDNARHIEALKFLLHQRPENSTCADCGLKSMGSRPTWASINLGVFICLRCAGIHRSLGVHISQVRSCSLDVWAYHQVEFMARCGGNTVANAFWEHGLEKKPRILTIGDLEGFIRDKYGDRKYCSSSAESVWPPDDYRYIDDDVWTVLKGAMNEQQLADFECRREGEHVSMESSEDTTLITLLDGDYDLIGLDGAPQDDPIDPFSLLQRGDREATIEATTVPPDIVEEFATWDVVFTSELETSATNVHDSNDVNGVAETLEYLGLTPRVAPQQKCTNMEHENALASKNDVQGMNKQHQECLVDVREKKARDLLAVALHDFDMAAGIASVSPKALYTGTLSPPKDKGCPMIKK